MVDDTAVGAWDAEYASGRYEGEPPVGLVDDIVAAAKNAGTGSGLYIGCGNGLLAAIRICPLAPRRRPHGHHRARPDSLVDAPPRCPEVADAAQLAIGKFAIQVSADLTSLHRLSQSGSGLPGRGWPGPARIASLQRVPVDRPE